MMTPQQMQHEEKHAALMAVAHSLTAYERVSLLGNAGRAFASMDGAEVADVLDYTTDNDMYLPATEPFYEKFGGQLPQDAGHATAFAVHAVILLHLELTPGRVISFLQRAGATEAPRFPEVEVGLHAFPPEELRSGAAAPDANHLLLKARAEQGMRAAGIPEHVITTFRDEVRKDGVPGFSYNAADIARWVTFVGRYTEMPRKVYDPTHDLAVVTAAAFDANYRARTSPELAQALANLRSHVDVRAPETIEAGLRAFYGKEAQE